jgi:plastocyanin
MLTTLRRARRLPGTVVRAAATVILVLALAACSSSATPARPAAPGTGVTAADTLSIAAQDVTFSTTELRAPAGRPFHIAFENRDDGIPHSIAIESGSTEVWRGEVFNGVATKTYDVPALPAGSYRFVCTVHQGMSGTLIVGP